MNYYNEIDPYCAHWLYNLIQEKLIPPGHIDTRPIQDVRPRDLAPYTQCHFFAGIAGWPLALRLANISPDFPIWTGSCPCQPFSAAGLRRGFADERHLWPHWFHLIGVCRPPVIVGEQVARAGVWLDTVLTDLEAEGYACGSAVLPAASVGAPHRRERFWFVGHADERYAEQHILLRTGQEDPIKTGGTSSAVSDASTSGCESRSDRSNKVEQRGPGIDDGGWWTVEPDVGRVAHGFFTTLDSLCVIERQALEEVERYGAARKENADQVLQMVRDFICSQPGREGAATGMCFEFHETEVLLAFLLCVSSARATGQLGRSGAETRKQAGWDILRGVREHKGTFSPSCGRSTEEQRARKSPNTLFELSFVLARYAAAYQKALLDAHASSSRVSLLRALGNAIVSQVAAEFLTAALAGQRKTQ